MNKNIVLLLLACCPFIAFANRTMTISVTNPSNIARTDVPIIINLAPYGTVCSALVTQNGQEIPCQLDDLDQNETSDELCFLANLEKKEKKEYTVTLLDEGEPRPYPARVFAEMVMGNNKDKNQIGRAHV